jgi:hypothetical protein
VPVAGRDGEHGEAVDPVEQLLDVHLVALPDLQVDHLAHLLGGGELQQVARVVQSDLRDQAIEVGAGEAPHSCGGVVCFEQGVDLAASRQGAGPPARGGAPLAVVWIGHRSVTVAGCP